MKSVIKNYNNPCQKRVYIYNNKINAKKRSSFPFKLITYACWRPIPRFLFPPFIVNNVHVKWLKANKNARHPSSYLLLCRGNVFFSSFRHRPKDNTTNAIGEACKGASATERQLTERTMRCCIFIAKSAIVCNKKNRNRHSWEMHVR